jgi:hypothetical protein
MASQSLCAARLVFPKARWQSSPWPHGWRRELHASELIFLKKIEENNCHNLRSLKKKVNYIVVLLSQNYFTQMLCTAVTRKQASPLILAMMVKGVSCLFWNSHFPYSEQGEGCQGFVIRVERLTS